MHDFYNIHTIESLPNLQQNSIMFESTCQGIAPATNDDKTAVLQLMFLTAWKIDKDGNSRAFFTLIISHFRIQGLIELTCVCNRNALFVSVDTR